MVSGCGRPTAGCCIPRGGLLETGKHTGGIRCRRSVDTAYQQGDLFMRRPKFGSALAAVAIATAAAIPLLALPAGAVNACGAPGGIFPATPGAQSGVKFDCTTIAGA